MIFRSYMNDWKTTVDRDAFCIVGFIFHDDADPRGCGSNDSSAQATSMTYNVVFAM